MQTPSGEQGDTPGTLAVSCSARGQSHLVVPHSHPGQCSWALSIVRSAYQEGHTPWGQQSKNYEKCILKRSTIKRLFRATFTQNGVILSLQKAGRWHKGSERGLPGLPHPPPHWCCRSEPGHHASPCISLPTGALLTPTPSHLYRDILAGKPAAWLASWLPPALGPAGGLKQGCESCCCRRGRWGGEGAASCCAQRLQADNGPNLKQKGTIS